MMDKGNLEKKSLADLRYIAKMMKIKSPTTYKKSELIELIISSDNAAKGKEETSGDLVQQINEPATDVKDGRKPREKKDTQEKAVKKTTRKTKNLISADADSVSETAENQNASDERKETAAASENAEKNDNGQNTAEDLKKKKFGYKENLSLKNTRDKKIKENTKLKNKRTAEKGRNLKKSDKNKNAVYSEMPQSEQSDVNKTSDADISDEANDNIQKSEINEDSAENNIENEIESAADDNKNIEQENVNTKNSAESNYSKENRQNTENQSKDVEGVLEIMQEGYGFLRTENFIASSRDVYVPPTLIRKCNMKTGDLISGKCRMQKENDKSQALVWVSAINGYPLSEHPRRRPFESLTPIYPDEKLVLEVEQNEFSTRLIDLIAPIGKGQRGMIVSPPKAGKTVLLKKIANSITANYPDVELIVLLIDERPEEVTDMRESVNGTVVSSTFDELPERHIKVSELVLERAQRLVEYGKDVVILMDSITRLARAYNLTIPPTGRSLSGGLDPGALHKPKKFFGAARNIRGGGSLTIVATALVDTGSKLDDVIFEEFKGTGNMELHLDRKLSEKRIFPAIDINKSGTRKEELLLTERELNTIFNIRRAMSNLGTADVTEVLVNQLTKTKNNEEFILSVKFAEKT